MEASSISCPECGCKLEVPVESIGTDAECPQCKVDFIIPDFLETEIVPQVAVMEDASSAPPADEGTRSILESLTESEIDILTEDFGFDKTKMTGLKKNKRWECTLISMLIKKHLTKLSEEINSTGNARPGNAGMSRRKYKAFIEEKYYGFLALYEKLYILISRELIFTLEIEEIKPIEKFSANLEDLFSALIKFHKEISNEPPPQVELSRDVKSFLKDSLPDTVSKKLSKTPTLSSNPYDDIKQLLAGWSPYCCESMGGIVEHLEEIGNSGRKTPLEFNLQLSLIPPTVYQFFKLANLINVGGNRKCAVYGELYE